VRPQREVLLLPVALRCSHCCQQWRLLGRPLLLLLLPLDLNHLHWPPGMQLAQLGLPRL
jgi:hypothetical protein